MNDKHKLCAILDMLGLDSDWVLDLTDMECGGILSKIEHEISTIINYFR